MKSLKLMILVLVLLGLIPGTSAWARGGGGHGGGGFGGGGHMGGGGWGHGGGGHPGGMHYGGGSISVEESAIIGAEASVYTAEAGLVSTAAREVFTEATVMALASALGDMDSGWG